MYFIGDLKGEVVMFFEGIWFMFLWCVVDI